LSQLIERGGGFRVLGFAIPVLVLWVGLAKEKGRRRRRK
jgi:hypothetical protein